MATLGVRNGKEWQGGVRMRRGPSFPVPLRVLSSEPAASLGPLRPPGGATEPCLTLPPCGRVWCLTKGLESTPMWQGGSTAATQLIGCSPPQEPLCKDRPQPAVRCKQLILFSARLGVAEPWKVPAPSWPFPRFPALATSHLWIFISYEVLCPTQPPPQGPHSLHIAQATSKPHLGFIMYIIFLCIF